MGGYSIYIAWKGRLACKCCLRGFQYVFLLFRIGCSLQTFECSVKVADCRVTVADVTCRVTRSNTVGSSGGMRRQAEISRSSALLQIGASRR